MLLLHLAGVDEETIARDYAASQQYMGKVFIHQKEQMGLFQTEIPKYVLDSDPKEMKKNFGLFRRNISKCGKLFDAAGTFQR